MSDDKTPDTLPSGKIIPTAAPVSSGENHPKKEEKCEEFFVKSGRGGERVHNPPPEASVNHSRNLDEKIAFLTHILDIHTREVIANKMFFPERARKLGEVMYLHFGTQWAGMYLPVDLMQRLQQGKFNLEEKSIQNLYSLIDTVQAHKAFSPSDDYSAAFITGDVGEIRQVKINGKQKEVLVIPQGKMRAKTNSANFNACNMPHVLSRSEYMLEVMALTMYHSGIKTPYFRGKGFADIRNDMALTEPELLTSFNAVTWDFFGLPSYQIQEKMKSKPKKLLASPLAWHGHPLSQQKIASTYQTRIFDRQTLLQSPRAKELGNTQKDGGDIAYFLPNGMLGDAVCQNLALVVPQNDAVKFIFVEGSEGNHFFEGKTQRTVYDVIQELKPEGVSAVKVHTPGELAKAAGYWNLARQRGRTLTYNTLKSKVDGMIVLGTFKGIEFCESLLPEEGRPITFPWKTRKTVENVQELLWKTVYGINGGTELTSDQHYCCMFDTNDLPHGVVRPLNLEGATLEDVI